MITEQALQEAIAECQGVPDPNRETCMMLAAFYTIQDHLFPQTPPVPTAYSYAPPPVEQSQSEKYIDYQGNSDFSRAVDGRNASEIWPIMDELMETLQAVFPRLYDGVMRQICQLNTGI